ncbi:hypothetical protein D3C76_1525230 [compost metagenome]
MGGVYLAGVVLLPQPVVQLVILRHLGRAGCHPVDLQGLLQGLGDREIEQGFVQIEQHPVITWLFHACPYSLSCLGCLLMHLDHRGAAPAGRRADPASI